MLARRTQRSMSVLAKSADLAVAVPQVVAHRVTRMAIAGPMPSARDRKEFKRMVAEKTSAFGEAWSAMAMQTLRANQALAASWFRALWTPSLRRGPSAIAVTAELQRAAWGVLGKGMAPVHRKAVANARRLSRTRLR
jgi:hypothetical protein